MSGVPVQSKEAFTTGGSGPQTASVTLTSPVGIGSLVVVIIQFGTTGSGVVTSITDDKSNTYNLLDAAFDGLNKNEFQTAYLANITNSPQTITVHVSDGANIVVRAGEISGLANSPLDGHKIQITDKPWNRHGQYFIRQHHDSSQRRHDSIRPNRRFAVQCRRDGLYVIPWRYDRHRFQLSGIQNPSICGGRCGDLDRFRRRGKRAHCNRHHGVQAADTLMAQISM